MKKYIIIYAVIFILLIAMLCTNGISSGIVVYSYNGHSAEFGIDPTDVPNENHILLIYNCIIYLSILITSLVITLKKSNKLKYKIPILILIIIMLLFEPIFMQHFFGGFSPTDEKYYDSILDVAIFEHDDSLFRFLNRK